MFRHNTLGPLVAQQPVKAHSQLGALFSKHGSLIAVARAINVDVRTVARWGDKLVQVDGLTDPFNRQRRSRKEADEAEASPRGKRVQASSKVAPVVQGRAPRRQKTAA